MKNKIPTGNLPKGMKVFKLNLWYVIIVAIALAVWRFFSWLWQDETENTQLQSYIVDEQVELNLNDFLTQYASGWFARVELEDEIQLKWYQKTDKIVNDLNLPPWTLSKSTDPVFNMFLAKKSKETSLTDLGIDPTWPTEVIVRYTERNGLVAFFVDQLLPLLLFVWLFVLLFRFLGPKWWGMPFGMSAGKLNTKSDSDTKFSDIAGMDEVKEELVEIIDFLKNPDKYHKVWARPPKWVLLYGEPWSGKTLLARAVAGEANVAFFSASGSEFMEMLVGMWASKVRQLFGKAKTAGKAIIFIDEIDAIGKKRGGWHTWGHQEQEQTLNQILTEMDGFDRNTNIVVMAATNRPDTLDKALLRAGRFDRKVYVGRPTLEERKLIFEYYLSKKKVAKDVVIDSIAKRTSGFVWADIENIVNEAALKVAKDDRNELTNDDFEYALEKLVMWPEKKIKSLKEKERNIVTYHELWHAVTAHELPNADPVEKISIVSRGQALGVTWMMPEEDVYLHSKAKFLDDAVTLLGGRAAEEIFFGREEITTGASNDFQRATKMISDLVVKYGMDEDLWPVMYQNAEWTGYEMYRPYSEKTAELIDKKIKWYLEDAYEKAKKILTKRKSDIEMMAKVLLKKEYLTKDEFELLMTDVSNADKMIADYDKEMAKKKKTDKKTAAKTKKKMKSKKIAKS